MSRFRFVFDALLTTKHSFFPREAPQELSHQRYLTTVDTFLQQNNTLGILSPVFGLLENNIARDGAGNVEDLDCLQQITADIAFSNAKERGDIDGMAACLIYRALERNTPAVGLPSELCTSITPTNPEIAALQQHQDPASPGAKEHNRAVTLELARQISLIRGNPLQALDSGTFAPGVVGSSNAVGNSCNDPDCIFIQESLVRDTTERQIIDYIDGCVPTVTVTLVSGETSMSIRGTGEVNTNTIATGTYLSEEQETSPSATSTRANQPSTNTAFSSTATTRSSTSTRAQPTTANVPPVNTPPNNGNDGNLQRYSGALLGIRAPAVRASGNGFSVDGAGQFNTVLEALRRSCDTQKNQCADAANARGQVTVPQCDQQNNECMALANS